MKSALAAIALVLAFALPAQANIDHGP